MKLVDGKCQRMSLDQALNEIGGRMLQPREKAGPDAIFWIGSSKNNNEQSYPLREFVWMRSSNNCDHQARICHSTTFAGVAQTYGYGAMTNSFNDLGHSKAVLFIGSNASEAHPISMLHFLHAKELGAKMIVVDPRFTHTARFAHHYACIRPGTDIPFVWGMLWHIFENGWQDKECIARRTYGIDAVREEVAKWPPVLQLALGNIGVAGRGANIYRGHDDVQGATDIGPNPDCLPS